MYIVHNELIDTAVSKLCWQRWSHLYQTVSVLMLRNETTRLEKFMHEHKLKWFSVSSNIILRRHEGFIEEIPQKYHILYKKSWKTNFHTDLDQRYISLFKDLGPYINTQNIPPGSLWPYIIHSVSCSDQYCVGRLRSVSNFIL